MDLFYYKEGKMNQIKHYINSENIRLIFADLTDIAKNIQLKHKMQEFSAVLLSKAFLNTALLSIDFKNKESISLQWQTNSPLGRIFVDAYNGNYIRGYIENSQVKLKSNTDEKNFLNNYSGLLAIIRYSLLKHPFKSIIETNEDSIDKVFTNFLIKSDQIDSKIYTIVNTDKYGNIEEAYGILIQLLPNGNKQIFNRIQLLNKSLNKDNIINLISKENFLKIYETQIEYRCTCSTKKIFSSLKILPKSELKELIKKGSVDITCNCCGEVYHYNKKDILNFINMENK